MQSPDNKPQGLNIEEVTQLWNDVCLLKQEENFSPVAILSGLVSKYSGRKDLLFHQKVILNLQADLLELIAFSEDKVSFIEALTQMFSTPEGLYQGLIKYQFPSNTCNYCSRKSSFVDTSICNDHLTRKRILSISDWKQLADMATLASEEKLFTVWC
jgi:hypothetical protein